MSISLSANADGVQPSVIRTYVDKLNVAVQTPLNDTQLDRYSGWITHVDNRRLPHHRAFRQRLRLLRPPLELLRLPQIFHGWLNYGELSLDWIFAYHAECEQAFRFVDEHHVKQHHRDQGLRWVKGKTRYTGPRSASTNLVAYDDRHDRFDGEINCVHLDWRMRGRDALRCAGITSIATLLARDVRTFWRERLLLRGVDVYALGRMINNQRNGTRRRQWDRFALIGETALRVAGSVQALIDQYRRDIRVNDCLTSLNVDHLLPEGLLYSDSYTPELTLSADNSFVFTQQSPDFARRSYRPPRPASDHNRTPLHDTSDRHAGQSEHRRSHSSTAGRSRRSHASTTDHANHRRTTR